ncbi:hypothetical protein [Cupriavidus metallidurans]
MLTSNKNMRLLMSIRGDARRFKRAGRQLATLCQRGEIKADAQCGFAYRMFGCATRVARRNRRLTAQHARG